MSLLSLSPLRRGAWRRWLIVLASTVALCSIPAVIAAFPVQGSTIGAAALRARIMASASRPFQGYAESTADFGLPSLPDLGNVSMLLDGTTDQYVWYRSADYWRADVVSAEGENDTYGDGGVTYLWNYGSNSLIQIIGAEPVRLPRAADLLPPELARRLLSIAGPVRGSAGCRPGGWPASPRPACGSPRPARAPPSARSTSGPTRTPGCRSRSSSARAGRAIRCCSATSWS